MIGETGKTRLAPIQAVRDRERDKDTDDSDSR
jgi:hypothetical protein